jgi:hypothetical protein
MGNNVFRGRGGVTCGCSMRQRACSQPSRTPCCSTFPASTAIGGCSRAPMRRRGSHGDATTGRWWCVCPRPMTRRDVSSTGCRERTPTRISFSPVCWAACLKDWRTPNAAAAGGGQCLQRAAAATFGRHGRRDRGLRTVRLLHKAGNYRVFAELERHAGGFPKATRYRPTAPRRTSPSGAPTTIWAWARTRW